MNACQLRTGADGHGNLHLYFCVPRSPKSGLMVCRVPAVENPCGARGVNYRVGNTGPAALTTILAGVVFGRFSRAVISARCASSSSFCKAGRCARSGQPAYTPHERTDGRRRVHHRNRRFHVGIASVTRACARARIVFGLGGGFQETRHLLKAEYDGQPVRLRHHGEMTRHLRLVERDAAENRNAETVALTVGAGTPVWRRWIWRRRRSSERCRANGRETQPASLPRGYGRFACADRNCARSCLRSCAGAAGLSVRQSSGTPGSRVANPSILRPEAGLVG